MEIIFRNIPLARSGHSDKRGHLSLPMFCMIPAHSFSRVASVYYKNTIIGTVRNLTFIDLHNGTAELRGDIVLDCSFGTVAELAFDEVYPVVLVSNTYSNKSVTEPFLARLSLACKDDREFEEQPPLNLSDLRDLVNSGFIGTVESTRDSKGKEPVITFDNEGQDIGNGILRYGHYKNGALMGYVVAGVTKFGGDDRRQESLDILEKFIEHQRGKQGGVTHNKKQRCDAIRVVSSFIPAINKRCKDEKSIDLIRRIISVVGASDNCRRDEVGAVYKMSLEEFIDRLVRDWCAAFQPSS